MMANLINKRSFWLFVREFFTHPALVGSAFPSSGSLAKKIAAQVPLTTSGHVLELGAGTGAVTQALLAAGIKPERLILVERSEALCKILHKRFPAIKMFQADAIDLDRLLENEALNIDVIISGLPMRSLPKEVGFTIGQKIEKLLPRGKRFIQFTYSWKKEHASFPRAFKYKYSKYVLFNIPPARVDVYTHE